MGAMYSPTRIDDCRVATLAAATLCALLCGCGNRGPDTYPVAGEITFDGKPVDHGDILFIPADNRLGPEGARVIGGKYSGRAKAGTNRVEITALDIGPDTRYEMGSPIAANFIPAHYNEQSTLSVEIAPVELNRADFQLSSKK
jgi:hypothetical protein